MKNSNFFGKNFFIIIIVTVAIYSIFLFFSDSKLIYDRFVSFDFKFIPLILITIFCSWLILFARWNLLLKNHSIKLPIRSNFLIYLGGFSLAISPMKSGELIKSELLKNKFNIKRTITVPIIVAERFYDVIGTIFVAVIGIIFLGTTFLPIIIFVIGLMILIFFIIYTRTVFNYAIIIFSKINVSRRFITPLENSHEILRKSSSAKLVLISTVLTICYRLAEAVGIYFVLLGFNINIIEYLTLASTYSTSVILGSVSMSPGGIGITEGSFGGILSLLGIELSTALALSIIVRIFTLWYAVIVGFISLKLSNAFKKM